MKKCNKCYKVKDYSKFHKKETSKDGYGYTCITCKRKMDSKRYDKKRKYPVLIRNKTRRQCRRCMQIFPTSVYQTIKDRRYEEPRLYSWCPECLEIIKYTRAIKKHGITVEQYEALEKSQNGLCYICKKPENTKNRRLSIDHDHSCCPGSKSCGKCIRGLLCLGCNNALGFVNDDIDILKGMISYLSKNTYII